MASAREALTPQMTTYEDIGLEWRPFLMFFHTRKYESPVLNTDAEGFRYTEKDAQRSSVATSRQAETNVVIGGSAAFGVGASSDAATIPSLLAHRTGQTWLNCGARGYGSTQELLLYLFVARPSRVRRVVIFSGINDLYLALTTERLDEGLGGFFFSNRFHTSMTCIREEGPRMRPAASKTALHTRRAPEVRSAVRVPPTASDRLEALARLLRTNLSLWGELAKSRGVALHYVLQPTAFWLPKEPATEESTLFSELDRDPQNPWRSIAPVLSAEETYRWYRTVLALACTENHIEFSDMNTLLPECATGREWLFVDRVHLTDLGNRLVAECLVEKGLMRSCGS